MLASQREGLVADDVAHVAEDKLVIDDAARFRSEAAADLAWTAAFATDDATRDAALTVIPPARKGLGNG